MAHAITHIVHLLFPSSTHFAALESRESDLCSTGTWSCKRTSRDSPKEIRCYQVSEGITKWYEWWNLLEQRISCGESEHQIAGELSAPWKSRWRGRCRCGHCAPKVAPFHRAQEREGLEGQCGSHPELNIFIVYTTIIYYTYLISK